MEPLQRSCLVLVALAATPLIACTDAVVPPFGVVDEPSAYTASDCAASTAGCQKPAGAAGAYGADDRTALLAFLASR